MTYRIAPKRRASSKGESCVIYARISQDKRDDSAGVQRQLEDCRTLAERNGWNIVGEYVDNSISATSGKVRPEFERLLASKPERIVVWHTDRLARLGKDLERVIDLNVDVIGVTAGHLDLSNANGRMTARIGVAVAQAEGEHKAERIERQAEQRASRGEPKWSRRPFGYESKNPADGIRESEAQHVRQAYENVIRGVSLRSIAKDWNGQGIRTTSDNEWRVTEVGGFLRNARNAGILVFRGDEVGAGTWEGIVSEATYRAAMRVLSDPKRRTNNTNGQRTHLLSGLAVCAKCGGRMHGCKIKSGVDKGQPGYRCAVGDCVRNPADYLDGRAFLTLLEVLRDPKAQAAWGHRVSAESNEAAGLETERERLAGMLTGFALDYADGLIDREAMLAGTARTRETLDQVDEQLAAIGERDSVADWWGDTELVAQELDDLSTDELRELMRKVMPTIKVHGRGRGRSKLTPDLLEVVDLAGRRYPTP